MVILFLPNPWANQKLDYPTHISSVPTPGINNEQSLISDNAKSSLPLWLFEHSGPITLCACLDASIASSCTTCAWW
jgi:hypothetical protein